MIIRPIQKSEWEKLRVFNEREYQPGYILTNKTYYDWQFDNPFNGDRSRYASLGVFDGKDNLLGTLGLFLAPCNFFGKTIQASWIGNLIVAQSLRNLGYGYLLLEKGAALGDMAVDHNINQQAWPLFTKSGWHGGDVKRRLLILEKAGSEMVMGQKDLDLTVYQPVGADQIRGFSFKKIAAFGPDFDNFWNIVKDRFPLSIERSAKYLNWRYVHHPMIRYNILAAKKDDQIVSYIVIRMEDVTDGAERKKTGVRIGRIIDFVSQPEADLFTLIKAIDFCRDQGVSFIDFFFTGNFYNYTLRALGFVDADEPPYNLMPTLLNPIDLVKRTRHNFAFKIMKPELQDARVSDLNNWYTTKGGGDQDRPY